MRLKYNKKQQYKTAAFCCIIGLRRLSILKEKDVKKKKKIVVGNVQPGSIAEEAGIEPQDLILSINDSEVMDVFDYRFLTTNESFTINVEKPSGEIWEIEIEKDEYEDLGIEFEDPMMDDAKSCTNNCIFCFIDQLPKGMRNTLYFKDDDSRLSFMMGNYVTLTNMKDADIDRIIKYRMSPINISVHTTNPELRKTMLRNRFAGGITEKIKKLVEAGIVVNGQIVLCRGINDGRELDRTIEDLSQFFPGLLSISVVPVGLTRYREHLFELQAFDMESSKALIKQVEGWQLKLLSQHGKRIIYIADEFYIMAGVPIPDYEEYEDFPQIENGVGLVSLLRYEVDEVIKKYGKSSKGQPGRKISIATGTSPSEYIKEMTKKVSKAFNVEIKVYTIINNFFGEKVTVTGLLTGGDIIAQLEGRDLGDELLISSSMLRSGEEVFLDDLTLDELSGKLNVKVTPVMNSGIDFAESIIGYKLEKQ